MLTPFKKRCFYCEEKFKKKEMYYFEVNDYDCYSMYICNHCIDIVGSGI
jgi:hypothetical protein